MYLLTAECMPKSRGVINTSVRVKYSRLCSDRRELRYFMSRLRRRNYILTLDYHAVKSI